MPVGGDSISSLNSYIGRFGPVDTYIQLLPFAKCGGGAGLEMTVIYLGDTLLASHFRLYYAKSSICICYI